MLGIIKQWPISSLLPMCTTDAGLSIVDLNWQKGAAGAISIPGDVTLISSMFQQRFDTPHGGT